eukprot:m.11360 g.11360  ORF g.11360 m.11360 type:complete len:351 (+) comp5708_c0_seq2:321-1373(+)
MREVHYEFEIDSPWDLTLLAYDRKSWSIPNPDYKEVLRCDFDNWDVDPTNGITKFRRRVQVAMPFPNWIMRWLTDEKEFYSEFETVLDRPSRSLVVTGTNLTLRSLAVTHETLRMFAHPDHPETKTMLTYDSSWEVKHKGWAADKFERLIATFYYRALKRGRQLDKRYIDQYKRQHGTDNIPLTRSEQTGLEIHRARTSPELSKYRRQADDGDSVLANSSLTTSAVGHSSADVRSADVQSEMQTDEEGALSAGLAAVKLAGSAPDEADTEAALSVGSPVSRTASVPGTSSGAADSGGASAVGSRRASASTPASSGPSRQGSQSKPRLIRRKSSRMSIDELLGEPESVSAL